MPPLVSKRLLQATVAVLALIPTLAGAAGVLIGPAFLTGEPAAAANLDSHLRFLSGIFFAVGLAFYATIPSIERKGALFRLAAALVFTGGLARLVSLWAVGRPAWPHLVGLVMELAVVPALVYWQSRVARSVRNRVAGAERAMESQGRRDMGDEKPRKPPPADQHRDGTKKNDVDEASDASFPASDPPSFTGTHIGGPRTKTPPGK